MAGCLDHCRLPDWECFENLREKRNAIASCVAGTMVRLFVSWCLFKLCLIVVICYRWFVRLVKRWAIKVLLVLIYCYRHKLWFWFNSLRIIFSTGSMSSQPSWTSFDAPQMAFPPQNHAPTLTRVICSHVLCNFLTKKLHFLHEATERVIMKCNSFQHLL